MYIYLAVCLFFSCELLVWTLREDDCVGEFNDKWQLAFIALLLLCPFFPLIILWGVLMAILDFMEDMRW